MSDVFGVDLPDGFRFILGYGLSESCPQVRLQERRKLGPFEWWRTIDSCIPISDNPVALRVRNGARNMWRRHQDRLEDVAWLREAMAVGR